MRLDLELDATGISSTAPLISFSFSGLYFTLVCLETSVGKILLKDVSRILAGFLACLYVTAACALTLPSDRDPKYNSSINPKYNSSINPTYNSSINPKYNSSANPSYNSSINPLYNSSINPKYNSSINPQYNSSLSPRYNRSLDPTKSSWSGFYVFDLDGNLSGAAVRAERGFLLFFSLSGTWQGYFAGPAARILTTEQQLTLRLLHPTLTLMQVIGNQYCFLHLMK